MDIEGAEVPVLNHLIDTGGIDQVRLSIVETHERFSARLAAGPDALRVRHKSNGLDSKIRLDWI